MYRQNSHTFPLKKPLQYGPFLMRTTDTKSRPLGANSYKRNLFITDTPGEGVDNLRYMYHFLSAVTQTLTLYRSRIPIPEHVFCFKIRMYSM